MSEKESARETDRDREGDRQGGVGLCRGIVGKTLKFNKLLLGQLRHRSLHAWKGKDVVFRTKQRTGRGKACRRWRG